MKKITKIISMVLVLAMATLAFCSCGASAEARVAEALEKMINAEREDCTLEMNVAVSFQNNKTEMPITMHFQSDLTDAENPLYYADVSATSGNITTLAKSFYKDGYYYVNEGTVKRKSKMEYEKMMEDTASIDVTSIFEAKKENIAENFDITRNEDGTLHVETLVTTKEFHVSFYDLAKQLAEVIGLEGVYNVADTLFQFEIDNNNNVTSVRAIMTVSMAYQSQNFEATYTMHFTYNPVSEDFEINFPDDIDDYTSFGFGL